MLVAVWPAAHLGAQHAGTAPSAQGEAPVHPAGGLLLVGPQDYEPFSFIGSDGKPSGFDVDVVNAISQQINVPITVQLLPAGEVAAAVAEGKADGVLGMGVLPDQVDPRNQWQMCGPTLRRVYRIFINSDNSWIPDNANLKDLAGTRVAVLADDPVVAFLGNDRTLGLDMLRRPRDGCAWITAHRVTAFVADENVIRYGARGLHEGRPLRGSPGVRDSAVGPGPAADLRCHGAEDQGGHRRDGDLRPTRIAPQAVV